ncbi:MAG: YceI family protein [Pseudonocardia sp.]|nr:YceI family protein [Pseudonocardia sp.]
MAHYKIVADQSTLSAEAKSSLHPIHAEARHVAGWVEAVIADGSLNAAEPANARIELAIDALRADNALVNREIQKRLDSRRYPTVVAEIHKVSAGSGDRYEWHGDLTLRHVTKPVTGWAQLVSSTDSSLRVTGGLTLDIRDFGLDPPKLLGMRVYPEVTVSVQVAATT